MGQWVLCQDESDSPRSYEGRSPRNTKQQINKTVPRVEYGLHRRERSLFFFGELASPWDNKTAPRGRFFRRRLTFVLELSKTIDVEAFYILVYNSFWLASVVPRRTASIRVSEI